MGQRKIKRRGARPEGPSKFFVIALVLGLVLFLVLFILAVRKPAQPAKGGKVAARTSTAVTS